MAITAATIKVGPPTGSVPSGWTLRVTGPTAHRDREREIGGVAPTRGAATAAMPDGRPVLHLPASPVPTLPLDGFAGRGSSGCCLSTPAAPPWPPWAGGVTAQALAGRMLECLWACLETASHAHRPDGHPDHLVDARPTRRCNVGSTSDIGWMCRPATITGFQPSVRSPMWSCRWSPAGVRERRQQGMLCQPIQQESACSITSPLW
jgi:hypothetical protein